MTRKTWFIVAYVCLTSAAICCSLTSLLPSLPRVRVESGELSGSIDNTAVTGRPLYAFLGIPYASPPVYKNRFKEPQPVKPWVGVWNATIPGSDCIGLDHGKFKVVGSEDCLYLNVYTPKLPQEGLIPGGLMNVIVYIHGGAFQFGAGIGYGPHYLLDSEDFVYVSINYRLGPLGFASTGDDVLPGNNGLKDQVAALKWIQRNIAAFGGNPGSVTIAGMSAGGASVHYHVLSPMSQGLFNRGIAESGSAFCNWANTENTIQKTKELAESLGCPTYYSKDTIKCLRSRPALTIANSLKNFLSWKYNPFSPFGPTVETIGTDRFLMDLPENLPAQDVPLLLSFTQEDGLYPAAELVSLEETLVEMESKWNEILPFVLDYNNTISDESLRPEIAQKIKTFYFGNNTVSTKTKKEVVEMLSDRLFKEPIARAAKHLASINTSPVYFYEFGYRGKYSLSDKYSKTGPSQEFGVSHGDDTMYVIKTKYGDPHDNVEDAKLIPIMVKIWSSFAKTGKPKRNCWVHDINKEREIVGEYTTLMPQLRADPTRFFIYFRMIPDCFDEILGWISDEIYKIPTNFRMPISPSERLAIALRVPDVGNSTVWSPVSKNPTDPLKLIKITQNQTLEPQEYSNPGNHTFWSTLPLTEFPGINLPENIKHTEL